jgi:heme/copper-type cytochrome/quinol oxidase subunit 2
MSTALPAKDPTPLPATAGQETIRSFESFLSFVLSLSIFGASTFAIVVSEIANPNELSPSSRFTRETVRTFLGIAWLLFVVALGVVAVSMSLLAYKREQPVDRSGGSQKLEWERLGLVASSLIQVLVVTAFLFLSLVLVAYAKAVGWVAVALSSLAAVFAIASLAAQWL